MARKTNLSKTSPTHIRTIVGRYVPSQHRICTQCTVSRILCKRRRLWHNKNFNKRGSVHINNTRGVWKRCDECINKFVWIYRYIYIYVFLFFQKFWAPALPQKHLLHINNEDIWVHRTTMVCGAYVREGTSSSVLPISGDRQGTKTAGIQCSHARADPHWQICTLIFIKYVLMRELRHADR